MSVTDLVFQTGFDLYTDLTSVWNNITPFSANFNAAVQSPGRFGYGQCVQLAGSGTAGILTSAYPGGPYPRFVAGFAYNLQSTTLGVSGNIFAFLDDTGAPNCGVFSTTLGRIGWTNGSTQWLSAPLALPYDQWAYVEVDIIFGAGTAGSVEIRVNGQVVLTETGIAASTISESFGCGPSWPGQPYPASLFDDIYVRAPSSTTLGDSFLGDVKCVYVLPTAAGHDNAFTQTGGTAGQPWTAVNNIPPDGDTSYVASNTAGQAEVFECSRPSSITPVAAIYGVSGYALSRKDDSPSRVLSVGVSDGVTDYFDAGSSLGSAYKYVVRQFPVNPVTGVAWTDADFATLQFGVKLIS